LVIDFCAYLRKEVKTVIKGLTNRLKLYVLISTDSVYDVCDVKIRNGPVREIDDIRPHGEKEIKKLAEDEDYGHDKLKCEEYLRSHVQDLDKGNKFNFLGFVLKNIGFPFVCLRLPDVIGPYDSTCRLWAYVMWIKEMNSKPIHTQPDSRRDKLSFVYSKDVADQCLKFLASVEDSDFIKKVHN